MTVKFAYSIPATSTSQNPPATARGFCLFQVMPVTQAVSRLVYLSANSLPQYTCRMCMALPTDIKQSPKRSRLPLPLVMVVGGAVLIGIFFFALLLERVKSLY